LYKCALRGCSVPPVCRMRGGAARQKWQNNSLSVRQNFARPWWLQERRTAEKCQRSGKKNRNKKSLCFTPMQDRENAAK
ncbi:hypothetical protein, partial [Klebsiella pneumoniae]|uniref:hypothetical protein n=1 Tax=Klebsiella pneumoniae TaxID=573 RepID=UPI001C69B572